MIFSDLKFDDIEEIGKPASKQPKQDQVEEEDPYSDIEEYEESAADVDVEDDRDEL